MSTTTKRRPAMPRVAETKAEQSKVDAAFDMTTAGTAPKTATSPHDPPKNSLWTEREWLIWTWRYAKSVNLDPFALTVAILLREAMRIPPNLLVPNLGIGSGNEAGVNMYAALVGGSGDGKDTTEKTAAKIVPDILGAGVHIPVSGEGLAAMFARRVPELDADGKPIRGRSRQECANPRALLSISEVSQLAGASRISSSTLIATLLGQFMGFRFGAFNKNCENRLEIPDFAYRLCMSVNAQPDSADVFMDNEGKGFPQRFLWADVLDSHCDTDYDDRTPAPEGEFRWHVNYQPPTKAAFDALYAAESWDAYNAIPRTAGRDSYETLTLSYPEVAYRDAFKDSVARNRGTRAKRNSHHMLLVSHVAAVIGSMRASDLRVTADDWQLAKQIVAMSNDARERYLAAARASITDRTADEMQIKDDARQRVEERATRKAMDRILLVLDRDDPKREYIPERKLRNSLNTSQRRMFPAALDALKAEGRIEQRDGPDGGAMYSLSTGNK